MRIAKPASMKVRPEVEDRAHLKRRLFRSADATAAISDWLRRLLRREIVSFLRTVSIEMVESFTIHAFKDGNWIETKETGPTLTVAKANRLHKTGWGVHITDVYGRRYGPTRFNEILSFDRKTPIKF